MGSELLDEQIHRGDPDKPLILMVHGHGTSYRVWCDPFAEGLRDAEKVMIPFDFVLTDFDSPDPEDPFRGEGKFSRVLFSTPLRRSPSGYTSFWNLLAQAGYSLYTWSQSAPNRSVNRVITELLQAVPRALALHEREELILLCHSRGGLAGRAYLKNPSADPGAVRAMIQLATPNQGSGVAKITKIIGKFGRSRLIPFLFGSRIYDLEDREFFEAVGRYVVELLSYLTSEAIKELSPASAFMKSLKRDLAREEAAAVPTHLLVGNSPAMFRMFLERADEKEPLELLKVTAGFKNRIWPAEIRDEMGDGLVAVERTHLSYATEYPPYPVNHGSILVDPAVQRKVLEILAELG